MKSDSAFLIPSLLNWPLIFVLKQCLFTSRTSPCGSFLIVSDLVGIVLLETERCSASQEIPWILWNLSVLIMGTRVHLRAVY
jgi:hypothetical protein